MSLILYDMVLKRDFIVNVDCREPLGYIFLSWGGDSFYNINKTLIKLFTMQND